MAATPENTTLLHGESPSSGGWRSSRGSSRRWATASIALHLVVLATILYVRPFHLIQVATPGDRNGHRLLLTYNPGSSIAPSSALQSTRHLPPVPTKTHLASAPAPAVPAPPATTTSKTPDATPGADGLGDGNLTIALELAHPYPHPDLSQLPSGTRGDVVVDIVIDKTGRIAKYTIAHGLGHGIDETVLATIQQWTFQPATRNGQPVDSEQELLFHYERG